MTTCAPIVRIIETTPSSSNAPITITGYGECVRKMLQMPGIAFTACALPTAAITNANFAGSAGAGESTRRSKPASPNGSRSSGSIGSVFTGEYRLVGRITRSISSTSSFSLALDIFFKIRAIASGLSPATSTGASGFGISRGGFVSTFSLAFDGASTEFSFVCSATGTFPCSNSRSELFCTSSFTTSAVFGSGSNPPPSSS
mmetsp:Transcript_16565/g.35997  ORF Transcript_16565/g.35997 Transcript_16565/m.35997 type:complete len:201 (+) Transcript_16565:1833-2435(+)